VCAETSSDWNKQAQTVFWRTRNHNGASPSSLSLFLAPGLGAWDPSETDLEDEPTLRYRLAGNHQTAKFVDRFLQQSSRLLSLKTDADGTVRRELEWLTMHGAATSCTSSRWRSRISTGSIRASPARTSRACNKRDVSAAGKTPDPFLSSIDAMFTGQEGSGRFLDLTKNREEYFNLNRNVKKIT
jgi:splicing factor 3A subunit 3